MVTLDETRYRRQQEEFVSNHGGTTPREIMLLLLPNVFSTFLTISISALLRSNLNRNLRNVLEFFLTIVPAILCCTILSDYLFHVCAVLFILSMIALILISIRKSTSSQNTTMNFDPEKLAFITNFRAWTNITTAICILAVDFKIFPRKFAKTEVYGYSLMDSGVGLFIIANALVAPEARGRSTDQKVNLYHAMIKSFKGCIPLLTLGFGRFFAIEYLGYQRHVTEYGVHWNFFITLAFVKLLTSMISKTISSNYSLLSGLWILSMYEYGLNIKDFKKWILSEGSRDDFVSANREGLISIPGYVGLYLIGVSIGKLIHSTYHNINSKENAESVFQIKLFKFDFAMAYNQPMILCIKLSLIASHFCAVMLICDKFFPVSRRLANAGYCAWIITLSSTLLTLLLLVDILIDIFVRDKTEIRDQKSRRKMDAKDRKSKSKAVEFNEQSVLKSPEIFEAVNHNGLCFFLLANILTGTINMSVRILYVDDISALKILVSYLAVSIVSVLVFYRLNVQIRL